MLLHYAPKILWTTVFLLISHLLEAQTTVSGTVTDATTHQPLFSVSIQFKGSRIGTVTDSAGHFTLSSEKNYSQVQFSFIGFKSVTKNIEGGTSQTLDVELEAAAELAGVTVKPHKVKYRNKDNPAVELIEKVIAHKDSNQVKNYVFAQYEQYEKIGVSLSNLAEKLQNNKLLRRYKFVLDNKDTTVLEQGRSTIPVYLEENISRNYSRKNPNKNKQIIIAEKKVDFGNYVDNGGIKTYLKYLYQDVNIYDNNVFLLTSQFLTPVAGAAPSFYMYTIMDTVRENNGDSLVKLNFTPRNPQDLLFRGTMWITLDGKYAIRKINLSVSKYVNLNWVREMHINQEFEQDSSGKYFLSKSEVNADFGLSKNKRAGGIYGSRTIMLRNFEAGKPIDDSIFDGDAVVTLPQDKITERYLEATRFDSLTVGEASVYKNIDSLTHMKSFRTIAELFSILSSGYVRTGPVEFGPLATFYAFNSVEGFRLRFGGRTRVAPYFSDKLQLEGYGAYGFKDQRWKYYGGITYSLSDRNLFQFPLKYIKISYLNDTRIPGQELQLMNDNNAFLSFTRGVNNKFLYNQTYRIEWQNETKGHFTSKLIYKNWTQHAAGAWSFEKMENGTKTNVDAITTSELSAEFRWAPGEQFYQGKVYRSPIVNNMPIFRMRLAVGLPNFLSGQYNYKYVGLNIQKRFLLSQAGYLDAIMEGGNTFGKVPYPLLTVHRANQTYAYQLASYNLMNFMEFVSDHYASINLDYKLNGFLFNKIPLLKRLKLREAVSFKLLAGGLRRENNPNSTSGLIEFSKAADGSSNTYSLDGQPYMEGSVGIMNIFKLLRIDLVKRFNYLDHPNVSKLGIRGWVRFNL